MLLIPAVSAFLIFDFFLGVALGKFIELSRERGVR